MRKLTPFFLATSSEYALYTKRHAAFSVHSSKSVTYPYVLIINKINITDSNSIPIKPLGLGTSLEDLKLIYFPAP